MKVKLTLIAISIVVFSFLNTQTRAATITWQGAGVTGYTDTVFNNPANWVGGIMPGAGDSAVMNLDAASLGGLNPRIKLTGSVTLGALTINSTGTPLITTGTTISVETRGFNLTVTRALTMTGNGIGGLYSVNLMIDAGSVINCGSLSMLGYSGTGFIGCLVNAGGTLYCAGDAQIINYSPDLDLVFNSGVGTATIDGTATVNTLNPLAGAAYSAFYSYKSLTFNGDVNVGTAGTLLNKAFLNGLSSSGFMSFNGANTTFGPQGAINSIDSVVFNRNGAQLLTINSSSFYLKELIIGTSNNPLLTVAGTNNPVFNNANSLYRPNRFFIKAGAAVNLNTHTLNRNSVTGAGTLTINGKLQLAGANNFPATFTTGTLATTDTVEYNGAVAQTIQTDFSYGRLIFNNTNDTLTYASSFPSVKGIATFTAGHLYNRSLGAAGAISFLAGSGSISSAASYVNGYAKRVSPVVNFVLPIGQSTYMPVTFTTANAATATAAWYDAGTPAPAVVAGITYNFAPGYYDVVTTAAISGVKLTLPTVVPANAHWLYTADNITYTDLGLATTAAVTLPIGTNKIYLANGYLTINAKTILQGAWGGSTMTTLLNSQHLIPAAQPYSGAPFSYAGTETTNTTFLNAHTSIVDWVLVEIRDSITPSIIVAQRAAFIGSDGILLDTNGTAGVQFKNIGAGNYFISIRHRNHLGIRSTLKTTLSSASALYNFTTAATQANGTNAMTGVSGTYCMWAGNTEYTTTGGLQVINYSIATSDVDFTRTALTNAAGNGLHSAAFAGPSVTGVYSVYDCNLDGNIRYSVSPSDVDLIRTNVTNVPGNGLHSAAYASLTEKLP